MRSNGHKLPVPAKVRVQLVLQVEEALLLRRVERSLQPENRSREEGPDLCDVGGDVDDLKLVFGERGEGVGWGGLEQRRSYLAV
jgi:hypothetical protein